MLAFILTALVALLSSSTAASPYVSICHQKPYRELQCLLGEGAAKDACNSLLPVRTVTSTMSTTTISYTTITRTYDASSQSTVSSVTPGAAAPSTLTITSGSAAVGDIPGSTSFVVVTNTQLYSTTVTTYIASPSSTDASDIPSTTLGAQKRQASCITTALSALTALACPTLETACSCLDFPERTRTIIETQTFESAGTTILALGTPPVTTVLSLAVPTETVTVPSTASSGSDSSSTAPSASLLPLDRSSQGVATTMTVSASVGVVQTSTVSLAAPTFTQVFGPRTGCEDTNSTGGGNLSSSIKSILTAESKCKDLCAQTPQCGSVYVQRMFPNYGDVKGYFACMLNEDPEGLQDGKDLLCGQSDGIWGNAVGFKALGRGTTPLR